MEVKYGSGQSEFGPGVSIELTGDEVATAIIAWLVAHGVNIHGPRTVKVNDGLCWGGSVYVDPSGYVTTETQSLSGRGSPAPPSEER